MIAVQLMSHPDALWFGGSEPGFGICWPENDGQRKVILTVGSFSIIDALSRVCNCQFRLILDLNRVGLWGYDLVYRMLKK